MQTIKIPINNEISAYDVFINNGYNKQLNENEIIHNKLIESGLNISWMSASTHFFKDNKVFVFSNWESNEYNQMVKNPKYIEAVDITDILKEVI